MLQDMIDFYNDSLDAALYGKPEEEEKQEDDSKEDTEGGDK